MSAASSPATTPAVCPHCRSTNAAPTEGNGVGNTMDCLDCGTDFTPTPAPPPVEIPAEISEKINALLVAEGEYEHASIEVQDADETTREGRHVITLRQVRDTARASLDAAIAELVRSRSAWEEFAWHLSGCVECGQTSYENCFDGKRLHDLAATPAPRDAE